MSKIYGENYSWTQEAFNESAKLKQELTHLLEHFLDEGWEMPEILYILYDAAEDILLRKQLKNKLEKSNRITFSDKKD